ncbi:MAG: hypothetical protein ACI9BD_001228 [Candidatus Marinamargulisbacteria bacterium]|jgi:uncharacterized protein (TIGR03546 family)
MSLWILKQLRSLIKAIESGQTPAQLAGGLVIGFWLGIVPFNVVFFVCMLSLLLLVNVNIGMGVLGMAIFGLIGPVFDSLSHSIGVSLLTAPFLTSLWTTLFNLPIIPLLNFNNTVSLGSMVIGLLLGFPVFVLGKKGVDGFRHTIKPKLDSLKITKIVKGSRFVKWIERIRG